MARAWYFKSTPEGLPTLDNVALVEMPPQDIGPNQIRVRNEYLSVDPYMRGRIAAGPSYAKPVEPGEVMQGGGVGVQERQDVRHHGAPPPRAARIVHAHRVVLAGEVHVREHAPDRAAVRGGGRRSPRRVLSKSRRLRHDSRQCQREGRAAA